MEFCDALTSVYRENPCQVLPNALWKTLIGKHDSQTTFECQQGVITRLEMWTDTELPLYWDRKRESMNLSSRCLKDIKFAILHDDYLNEAFVRSFAVRKPYFRLIHSNRPIPEVQLPMGLSIVDVKVEQETHKVAELIRQCYEVLRPSQAEVFSWSEHPTFEPDLWIWVIDETTSLPVALGIAEVDRSISEGSLEWIQVLPMYQSRRLGRAIVQELLLRLSSRSTFTTVSGQLSRQSSTDAFYRSCGFQGNDIWWVLKS